MAVTVGVLAAGTGISLAATQGGGNSAVTCIVVADANAAADANSVLSDVFAVGTKLHFTSGGRAVDVTVSGPITAATATTAPSATTAPPATTEPATTAPPTSAPAGSAPAKNPTKGGKHHHKSAKKNTPAKKATPAKSENLATAVPRSTIKVAANNGVDANSVCAKLSKNSFNTLGSVVDGNNVGAFIATMTPAGGVKPTTGTKATGGKNPGRKHH